jgi:hypothetical protein
MSESAKSWPEANQCYLIAALAVLRARLERHSAQPERKGECDTALAAANQAWQAAGEAMPGPAALEKVCSAFGLSPFERDILLLCAGIELDSSFANLCEQAQGGAQRNYPTFCLALAALPGAHWSALSSSRPLRRWRLIELNPGLGLTSSALRIDERVLHFLAGVQHLDERLGGIVEAADAPVELSASHSAQSDQIAEAWSSAANSSGLPIVQLLGSDHSAKQGIAAAACASLHIALHFIRASAVPTTAPELAALMRLWEREAIFFDSALLLDCEDLDFNDAGRVLAVQRFAEATRGARLIATPARLPGGRRQMLSMEAPRPGAAEQREWWKSVLGEKAAALNGHLDELVSQFRLDAAQIRSAGAQAVGQIRMSSEECGEKLPAALWDACRAHARPRLENLAQRIESQATWNDLVLPEFQLQTLREISVHVRQQAKVYETWGFAERCSRGLGISALFCGASGTGKMLAAEVLANELHLDLYRIDLSQVVSKYIGETEKNLRRVFDAAEAGGAILLFDEADALFGKRSDVKDSHDRYANIEVSYLLQRMEAYRGLAILTTNLKNALDTAFQRRLRFIVQFPLPQAAERARIWQRIFLSSTPTESLDPQKLAKLNVTGGNIRNIALNAAFYAADAR